MRDLYLSIDNRFCLNGKRKFTARDNAAMSQTIITSAKMYTFYLFIYLSID